MVTYAPNQLHAVPLVKFQHAPIQPPKYLDPQALNVRKRLKYLLLSQSNLIVCWG